MRWSMHAPFEAECDFPAIGIRRCNSSGSELDSVDLDDRSETSRASLLADYHGGRKDLRSAAVDG